MSCGGVDGDDLICICDGCDCGGEDVEGFGVLYYDLGVWMDLVGLFESL